MTRDTTTDFKNEIDNDVIRPRLLIKATFNSGTIYVWNGLGDLSWGGDTYSGLGELLSISDVVESTEIKVENLTITFSALSAAYKALALTEVDLKNSVTIYLALITSAGAVVADPETIFVGNMDEVRLKENGQTAVFDLVVNNRLIETQSSKERRYTNQDQQSIHPTDTGFRHMVNAIKQSKWGSTA